MLGLALTLLSWAPLNVTAEPATKTDFIHFLDEDHQSRLQVALASYINANGVQVDLVSAIHVGDATYYQDLNERFKHYDAVLYEMVGDPDGLTAEPDDKPSQMGAVRTLQVSLKRVLRLDFQLDIIDYTAANFVHADLTLDEFIKRQEERGETIFTFIQKAMKAQLKADGLADAPQLGVSQLIQAFMSIDRASALKRLVAEQLDFSEALLGAVEKEGETVILTDRNKRALEVLDQRLAEGDETLAIFYGAAHCLDLERRLLAIGFQRIGQTWLTAWAMPK